MADEKKTAEKKDEGDKLKDAVAKAADELEAAKEKHIEAGVKLEEARTKYQDFYGDESQKSQVKA